MKSFEIDSFSSDENLKIVKTASKTIVNLGDFLDFKISILNIGNLEAKDVVIKEVLENGIAIVSNTTKINGEATLDSIEEGINLGDLGIGSSIEISFTVEVKNMPEINPILNGALVTFNILDEKKNLTSNIVEVQVLDTIGKVSIETVSSKTALKVLDLLTYKTTIKNIGEILVKDTLFISNIQKEEEFLEDSLLINGRKVKGGNPKDGIHVGDLDKEEEITVVFSVIIKEMPLNGVIKNTSSLQYNYTGEESNIRALSSFNLETSSISLSNEVSIRVLALVTGEANIELEKLCDKEGAVVSEELTYTITASNTGDILATDVVLKDNVPDGTTFILGSVKIDGVLDPTANILTGVNLNSIDAKKSKKVTFKALVAALPNINPILNKGTVDYKFIKSPIDPPISKSGESNIVKTTIAPKDIITILTKTVDKGFSNTDGILTYTLNASNNSTLIAEDVLIRDTLPNGTVLEGGSVTLNGIPLIDANPSNGVLVKTLMPGENISMSFKAKLTNVFLGEEILNTGVLDYSFKPSLNSNSQFREITSNTVKTILNGAVIDGLGFTKSASKNGAEIGERITYTIKAKNTGNVEALNVVVRDNLQAGTTFVLGSITVDSVPRENSTPQGGINLGVIEKDREVIIKFDVQVDAIPEVNPLKNIATISYEYKENPNSAERIQVNNETNAVYVNIVNVPIKPGINGFFKRVDLDNATIGDILIYTFVAKNSSSVMATNVILKDILDDSLSFIEGSLTIDGVTILNANLALGVSLLNISPLEAKIVQFEAKVLKVPTTKVIENTGSLSYFYKTEVGALEKNITIISEKVFTQINYADISTENNGLIKSCDKKYATLGDDLTYTVFMKNTGNVPANNIIFFDTIPENTSFVDGSVTIRGIPYILENPEASINVGDLRQNESLTVTFKVKVTTVPESTKILNDSKVRYNFTVNPNEPNGRTKENISNTVVSKVALALIDKDVENSLEKYTDLEFGIRGNTITYTILVKNAGNVDAINVMFKDTINSGGKFIENSVTIDDIPKVSVNPNDGFSLGTIKPSQAKVVKFKVLVVDFPNPNPMINKGKVNYEYIVDPETESKISKESLTNEVTTKINEARISTLNGDFVKTSDKDYVKLEDIITYKVTLRNSGSTEAIDTKFFDTIPNSCEFIENSFTIDGDVILGANPENGVNIGILRVNQKTFLEFKVKVISLPENGEVLNEGRITYNYIIDPVKNKRGSGGDISNKAKTNIREASILAEKTANKEFAKISDILNYKIVLKNNGNTDANNTFIIDTLGDGATFIEGSLKINGVSSPLNIVEEKVSLGSIGKGEEVLISYSAKVTKIPVVDPIPNKAKITYVFTMNPETGVVKNEEVETNTTLVKVNTAIIQNSDGGFIKEVDKSFGEPLEILTYKIKIKNTGNVSATSVVLSDLIPEGLEFLNGSLYVNGELRYENIQSGITLNNINPLETVDVSFKVKVLNIPIKNPVENKGKIDFSYLLNPKTGEKVLESSETNKAITKINSPLLSLEKTPNKSYATVSDIITYTIKVEAKGNTSANNIVLYDTLPKELKFVKGSVLVNGEEKPLLNPEEGIALGNINAKDSIIITYKGMVLKIPEKNPIINVLEARYTFTKNPEDINGEERVAKSNEAKTIINNADISYETGGLIKEVDKSFVDVGETVTYKVTLINKGNVKATSVVLIDKLKEELKFIENSVIINRDNKVSFDPNIGIPIGSIEPEEKVIVSFKALVVSLPNPNVIENTSKVQYNYTIDESLQGGGFRENTSNKTLTVVNRAIILNGDGGFVKEASKEYGDVGDEITYKISLKNTGNVVATNVILKDTLASGISYVENTLVVDGENRPMDDISKGVSIGDMLPSEEKIVKFIVKIDNLPKENPILNFGTVSYKYLVDPTTERYGEALNRTNVVKTKVNRADISYKTGGFVKYVDKEFIDFKEILVYTIKLENKGNVEALNVFFKDTIPENTEFIKDSLSLNGIIKQGVSPEDGINLGTIEKNEVITVSFKVLNNSIKEPEIINNSSVSYKYFVDSKEEKNVTNISNTVKTKINYGEASILKSVDKTYATINEEVEYKIVIENIGNTGINDVFVLDTVPSGTQFIDNSLRIDGVFIEGENLQSGVEIGSIGKGEKRVLEFKVLVFEAPKENPIPNTAKVSYNYLVDPIHNIINSKEKVSNKVNTWINYVIIDNEKGSFTKEADKEYTDINEKISYTIKMKNLGNTKAQNIVFTDTIGEGIKFIEGSLKLNGEIIKDGTPEGGIDVGILNPGSEAKITFEVLVITIPKVNPILNKGAINYRFTKDPSIPLGEMGYETTNSVYTKVNHGEITDGYKETIGSAPLGGFTKVRNKEYVKLNEEVTYTFNIKNSGNVEVTNVVLKDLIPESMKFIRGSVTIEDVKKPEENPEDGIIIPLIEADKSIKVSFKVLVVSLPKTNKIENMANLEYSYKVSPKGVSIVKKAKSNLETIFVNAAIIDYKEGGLVKEVDLEYAKLKDILNYRFVIKNTGNVEALDLVFKDPIPKGTSFIKGSVLVNGERKEEYYPQASFNLGNLKVNAAIIVEFKVQVVSVVSDGIIDNKCEVLFSYKVNPNEAPITDQSFSNKVTTKLNTVDFTGDNFKKIVSPTKGTIDDIIDYTFEIRNGGNVNATKVVFKDVLKEEVEFIKNSVTLNGEVLKNADPRVGIGIATIAPNEKIIISFKAKIIKLPEKGDKVLNIGKLTYENIVDPRGEINVSENYSNVGELQVKKAIIKAIKSPCSEASALGDDIQYKIVLKNIGNTVAKAIEVYDKLPECLEFIEDSVTVDCIDSNENIVSSVLVGDLEPGETREVSFKARVICKPEDGIISNKVYGNYIFEISEDRDSVFENFSSNVSNILVESPIITVTKCGDREIAKYGDEINFYVKVENTGTLDAFNVKVFDLLPEQLKLIGSVVCVNGQGVNGADLRKGISIGNLKVKEWVEISYKVLVVKGCCRKLIENTAYAEFIYQVRKDTAPKKTRSNVASYTLKGVSTSFKQLTVEGIMRLPNHMPKIEDIVEVKGNIEITKQYVIDTISGYSVENKRITGHKLVVNGRIFESLEFIALEPTQTTHYSSAINKFSTFIILQEDYHLSSNVEVVSEIEEIHWEQIGEREVYVSVTFMLDAVCN